MNILILNNRNVVLKCVITLNTLSVCSEEYESFEPAVHKYFYLRQKLHSECNIWPVHK